MNCVNDYRIVILKRSYYVHSRNDDAQSYWPEHFILLNISTKIDYINL